MFESSTQDEDDVYAKATAMQRGTEIQRRLFDSKLKSEKRDHNSNDDDNDNDDKNDTDDNNDDDDDNDNSIKYD